MNHEHPNQYPDPTNQEINAEEREHLLAQYANEVVYLWTYRDRLLGHLRIRSISDLYAGLAQVNR